MNAKKENIRYAMLLGLYMMMMCAGFGYVTYFLLEAQLLDSHIGILIAVSCAVAVALQQFLGRLVDTRRLDGKKTLLFLTILQSAVGFLVTFLHVPWLVAVLFGILLCTTLVMQPILNSFSFYYEREGISVNYGVARGVGSLCYSGCSMLLGFLTVRFGSFVVPLSFGFIGIAILLLLLPMPALQGGGKAAAYRKEEKRTLRLSRYPAFVIMLVGLCLVMLFHNMIMTYFIYVLERVGGNSGHLGVAIGIGGLVEIPILFLYTKIKGKRPSVLFLAFSGVAFFAKAVLFVFAQSIGMIYAIQCLQCLAFGLMAASRVYYVDEVIGKENEATGQAYMSATETVGIVFGSMLGGLIMQSGGVDSLLWAGAALCLLGMLCMLLAAWKNKKWMPAGDTPSSAGKG